MFLTNLCISRYFFTTCKISSLSSLLILRVTNFFRKYSTVRLTLACQWIVSTSVPNKTRTEIITPSVSSATNPLLISVHVFADSFHTTLLLHIWTTKFGFVQAIFALSAIIPVAIRTFTTCLATFAPRSHFIYFFMAEIRISTIECALENWSVVNCANNVSSM